MLRTDIPTLLYNARTLIENLLSVPDLLAYFEAVGRDHAFFEAARDRVDEAQRLHHARAAAEGDRIGAVEARDTARREAQRRYMHHLGLARLAFPADGSPEYVEAAQALGLTGTRKRALAAWLEQAGSFYRNALSESAFGARLATFGVDEAELEAGLAAVEAVAAAQDAVQRATGAARQATAAQYEALTALQRFYGEQVRLARLLVRDQPQRLESLGILVRS